MAPYQFKRKLGVQDADGTARPPNATEKERLHGYRAGHTKGFSEGTRLSFVGNTFHCIVVAYVLSFWAVDLGYLH